ncbi:glycosyl transferase, family 39 [Rickettsiella grylli]|uniref:Glycosyl transferase, family 39 n=1 Tax=Rickettsiella grylli TaxID=59196 RepID=A8PMJ0_9COXI|nr:glycosyl transferase, family 39 [Rickettsiella grylli]
MLVIKLLLAWFIPLTADEAYYAIWGTYLSGGGYDHPPMIGFVLYPFLQWSHAIWTLRLPAIFTSLILGVVSYLYLKKESPERAAITSFLLIISPISLFNIIITTDTPLFIFSFLSFICVLEALKKGDDWRWFALGGLFLGLAFFSKYFACLLGLAYAVYFIGIAPNRARLIGLGLLVVFTLPFVAQNIYWNYQHDWSNILFNIYNRNHDMGFRFKTLLGYILILLYLITPPLVWAILKFPKEELKQHAAFYFFFIPLLSFFILSSFKSIGLHWPLAFIPFIYMWAGLYLSTENLKKLLKFTIYWSGIQLLLIVSLLIIPIKWIQHNTILNLNTNKAIYFFHHKAINALLIQKYSQPVIYASPNYADASLFFYDTNHYASVFLKGSYHGREDDLITDFKAFNQKNFLIFSRTPFVYNDYKPYFKKVTLHQFYYQRTPFYYLLGTTFNYPVYRQKILKAINDTYWVDPPYLPHAPSFFYLKYFKN